MHLPWSLTGMYLFQIEHFHKGKIRGTYPGKPFYPCFSLLFLNQCSSLFTLNMIKNVEVINSHKFKPIRRPKDFPQRFLFHLISYASSNVSLYVVPECFLHWIITSLCLRLLLGYTYTSKCSWLSCIFSFSFNPSPASKQEANTYWF